MGIIVSQHAIDRTNVKSPDFYQKLPLCRSEEHTCRFCMESWPSWARVLEAAPRAPPTMKVEFAGHPTRYLPVAPGPRGMQQFKVPPAIPRRACPLRMQAFSARARGRARSTPIQVHSCSLWSGASAALHCPLSLHGSSSSAAHLVAILHPPSLICTTASIPRAEHKTLHVAHRTICVNSSASAQETSCWSTSSARPPNTQLFSPEVQPSSMTAACLSLAPSCACLDSRVRTCLSKSN